MKRNSLLSIAAALCAFILPAQAQTTVESPKAPAEEVAVDSRLTQIPPATDAEKKAIMEAIELATIEGVKFGFLNQKMVFQDRDGFIRKMIDLQQTTADRILNGGLKDKLPVFYKEFLAKSKEMCKEAAGQLATVKDLVNSPRLKELEMKNKAASAVYEDYFKREMGMGMHAYAMQEGQKLGMLIAMIQQKPGDYPSIVKQQKEMEGSTSPEQKEELLKKMKEEILQIAIEQYKKG